MMLEPISTQPVISAEDLDLRPVRKSDIGMIEFYTSDARVARMTSSIPHPLPPGATEAFVQRALSEARDEDVWVMDGSKTGGADVMGVIGLKAMDREQSEIGYWVAPLFWGKGTAQTAVSALIAANPLNNKTIFGSVFQDNPASARVLTNAGFEYLGDAESFCVARDTPVPTWTYLRKLTPSP